LLLYNKGFILDRDLRLVETNDNLAARVTKSHIDLRKVRDNKDFTGI
jgi:hypothetical protein